jgi:hypothetical protein
MEEEQNKENFGEHVEKEIEEARDVELMEFSLDKDEIEELILRLQLLKEEKGSVSFEIDDENELLIHYEKEEEEEVEEEEE